MKPVLATLSRVMFLGRIDRVGLTSGNSVDVDVGVVGVVVVRSSVDIGLFFCDTFREIISFFLCFSVRVELNLVVSFECE